MRYKGLITKRGVRGFARSIRHVHPNLRDHELKMLFFGVFRGHPCAMAWFLGHRSLVFGDKTRMCDLVNAFVLSGPVDNSDFDQDWRQRTRKALLDEMRDLLSHVDPSKVQKD